MGNSPSKRCEDSDEALESAEETMEDGELSVSSFEIRIKLNKGSLRGNSPGKFIIRNPSSESFIFKVMTTAPKNMMVRPNNGIMFPKSTVEVTVTPVATEVPPPPAGHKLLVISGIIKPTKSAVYDQELWKDAKLKDNILIRCLYEEGDSDSDSFRSATSADSNAEPEDISDPEPAAKSTSTAGAGTSGAGAHPSPPPGSATFPIAMTPELARANALYQEVQRKNGKKGGMSRPLKRKKLEEAMRIYEQELRRCYAQPILYPSSVASILRNKGMTNLRLADVVDSLDPVQEFQLVVYHLKEAVRCFAKALNVRPMEQTTEWGIGIEEKIVSVIDIGLRRSGNRKFEHQRVVSSELDKIFEAIPAGDYFNPIRTKCYLAKSQGFYNRAVVALETHDFRTTIQFLEYAREEKELAAKFASGNGDLLQEVKVIEEEILMHQCCCESVRVRSQADDLFNSQINEAENVDMRMMWTILDMYKEAVLLTREMDIENEACALCRLGRMYDKVFKLKGKSHAYYRQGFDLLQTLLPRNISSPWFTECKEALERFQRNVILEEQRREEAEKAPILEKLKPQLEQLKKVNRGDVPELLKFLYKTYPPKVRFEFKEEELNDRIGHKAVLMKTITYYHPDRQVNFGLDWKVLCGEITKILTVRYETYK